ncbi:hypothetical protein P692DRAFT_20866091 [Suillus brevipes Sb2]|nr:hypothetical protein P692DRAFT_20866091 [Suillus brevipes Sb2]
MLTYQLVVYMRVATERSERSKNCLGLRKKPFARIEIAREGGAGSNFKESGLNATTELKCKIFGWAGPRIWAISWVLICLEVQNPHTKHYQLASLAWNAVDLLVRWSNDVLHPTLHHVVAPPATKINDTEGVTPTRQLDERREANVFEEPADDKESAFAHGENVGLGISFAVLDLIRRQDSKRQEERECISSTAEGGMTIPPRSNSSIIRNNHLHPSLRLRQFFIESTEYSEGPPRFFLFLTPC